ncbi:MAG: hypothetical protein ACRDWH_06010 [Acidimicrobiia bacterium]
MQHLPLTPNPLTAAAGESMPLFQLRYLGSSDEWGFAIHLASKDGYEDSVLPHGMPHRPRTTKVP